MSDDAPSYLMLHNDRLDRHGVRHIWTNEGESPDCIKYLRADLVEPDAVLGAGIRKLIEDYCGVELRACRVLHDPGTHTQEVEALHPESAETPDMYGVYWRCIAGGVYWIADCADACSATKLGTLLSRLTGLPVHDLIPENQKLLRHRTQLGNEVGGELDPSRQHPSDACTLPHPGCAHAHLHSEPPHHVGLCPTLPLVPDLLHEIVYIHGVSLARLHQDVLTNELVARLRVSSDGQPVYRVTRLFGDH